MSEPTTDKTDSLRETLYGAGMFMADLDRGVQMVSDLIDRWDAAYRADLAAKAGQYDYDAEYGWIVENDGEGASRIVAKDVLPEFGVVVATGWYRVLAAQPTPPEIDATEAMVDGIVERYAGALTALAATPTPPDEDTLANALYVACVQPELTWWDDLPPDAQEAWRRAARTALEFR